jgi:hypothetical protein
VVLSFAVSVELAHSSSDSEEKVVVSFAVSVELLHSVEEASCPWGPSTAPIVHHSNNPTPFDTPACAYPTETAPEWGGRREEKDTIRD